MTTETPAPVEGLCVPNDVFRSVRLGLRLSQDEMARALRQAGENTREPNAASKRLVQRWESGTSTWPRPVYARALETVTGLPVEALGFVTPMARVREDGRGGHDLSPVPDHDTEDLSGPSPSPRPAEDFSGIWLSEYEFFSSGRGATFEGKHFVVLVQHGARLTGRSLENGSLNPDSPLSLDLTLDRSVVTGTWAEQTAQDGYYRGARYHGTLQLLVEPTGRRMAGKWAGFGKDMDINTGPWSLTFQDASTSPRTLKRYSVPPA